MKTLEHFLELSQQADQKYEYTVAWLDTSVRGKKMGRGLFMRANHQPASTDQKIIREKSYIPPKFTVPVNAPNFLINTPLIRVFNFLYFHRGAVKSSAVQHYNSYFYPLDTIGYWNRLYGKRGLQSHQSVLPTATAVTAIKDIISAVHEAGLASPLTVLKLFGDKPSPGIISFPQPGINLLLDFANTGHRLDTLLQRLDSITRYHGGRINLSKDAHISAETFQTFYPQWRELLPHIDPRFSSSFWRRVTTLGK